MLMNFREIPVQKMLLILFVFGISLMVGWYGEKAVEKFMHNDKAQNF